MGTRPVVETGTDRKALIADAGFGRLSFASAAAGVLTAYGAFAVLAGLVAGIIDAANVDIDVTNQWQDLGVGGALVVAGLLLVAYLFGGYVAGRMARRAGTLHGVAVFVLGVAVAAVAAVIARQLGGDDAAVSNLRDLGVPTTGDEWRDIATLAGIASLAAMLLGAIAGGVLGERWHTKLLTRALDPRIGAEAEAHRDSELRAAEAEERRVSAYQRVRATTPTRTRRIDREHDTDVDVDGDGDRDVERHHTASSPFARAFRTGNGTGHGHGRSHARTDDHEDDRTVTSGHWWRRGDANENGVDDRDESTVNGGRRIRR